MKKLVVKIVFHTVSLQVYIAAVRLLAKFSTWLLLQCIIVIICKFCALVHCFCDQLQSVLS